MSTLEFRGVTKEYRVRGEHGRSSRLLAVNDVSFTLESGKTVALVGQSGSGKSTIAKLLLQLERPTSGDILLDGKPVKRHGTGLRDYRNHVQMVFQDPFASLNPYHSIDHHLARPLKIHKRASGADEVDARVRRLLERVRLTPAAEVAAKHPHELSGGQRQRVNIARALMNDPGVLLIDEPTSALDQERGASIMELILRLTDQLDTSTLLVTHDLVHLPRMHAVLRLVDGRIADPVPAR